MTHSFTPEQEERARVQYDMNHAAMHCLNWLIEDLDQAIKADAPATPKMMEMACVSRFLSEYNVRAAVEAIAEGLLPPHEGTLVPPAGLPDVNEAGGK